MFSKQNQTDPSHAREAVKKQLLRSLMQQVVDEVSTMSGDEVDEMISSMIGEIDCSGIRQKIQSQVEEQFQTTLNEVDVASEVAEHKTKLIEEAERSISEQLEQNKHLVVEALSDSSEKIKQAVESHISEQKELSVKAIETELEEKISNLHGTLETAANTFVESKLASFDLESISSEATTKLTDALQAALSVELENATNHVTTDVKSHIASEVDKAIAESASVISTEIESKMATVEQSMVDSASQQLEAQFDRVKQEVESHFVEQFKANIASQDYLIDPITQAIVSDSAWNEGLSIRIINELVSQISKDVQKRVAKSGVVVQEAVDMVRNQSNVVENLAAKVRVEIIQHISSASLVALEDVDQTVSDARAKVALDNEVITEASELLRNQILQDVAIKCTTLLGHTEQVCEDARQWINDEDPFIQAALAEVTKTANNVVTTLVRQRLADTQSIVNQVVPEFTENTVPVRNAVEATREAVVRRISALTLEALQNVEKIKAEAAAGISSENEAVQNAVSSTVDLLVDDVMLMAENRMQRAEIISAAARDKMPKRIPTVVQAADVLENMLLSEVAQEASVRLFEVDQAADKASGFMKMDESQEKIKEQVLENVFRSIAADALSELAQTENTSGMAFKNVDLSHEYITGATRIVRAKILAAIASRATEQFENIDNLVHESRKLIASNNSILSDATSRLYTTLVKDVAKQTMQLVAESDKTSADVMALIQQEDEVIARVQEIVHDQMIERLLAHALDEIKIKVTDAGNDAEKAFFRSAMNIFVGGQSQSSQQVYVSEEKVTSASDSMPSVSNHETNSPNEVDASSYGNTHGMADKTHSVTDTAEAVQPKDRNDWTLLSEMDTHGENESADVKSPTWSVSEFRPTTLSGSETDATMGSTGDGYNSDVSAHLAASPYAPKTTECTFYLYGISSAESSSTDVFEGIEGLEPNSTVHTMKCGSLSAIVSCLSDPAFSPYMIRQSMKNNSWLKDQVRHHAGVLAEARGMMTIVPLRFGTVFKSEKEVQAFIQKRDEVLVETLSRLKDKSEFGIRVLCDTDVLSRAIGDNGSEFNNSISQLSPGVADFIKGQLKMDESDFADSSIEKAIENLVSQINTPLQAFSSETIVKDASNGFFSLDNDVIMNSTYLVPSVQEKNFRSKITEIAKDLDSMGVTIEVSGPWPPYHFVDIDMDGFHESLSNEMPV